MLSFPRSTPGTSHACLARGIGYLTLFAFSSENWRRPAEEVGVLMQLFRMALESEVERLQRVFSTDLGITATDGGEALTDISIRLNDAQWGKIVSQFLG